MSDPHDLVCVYNATNSTKAELVRNLLDAEGIRATTADTHSPFPGLSITPSEVYVERSREQEALSLIATAEQSHLQAADETGEEFAEEEAGT